MWLASVQAVEHLVGKGVEACAGDNTWLEQGTSLEEGQPLEGSDQEACAAGCGRSAAGECLLQGLQGLPCECLPLIFGMAQSLQVSCIVPALLVTNDVGSTRCQPPKQASNIQYI